MSQSPIPFNSSFTLEGILEGSFICAYVGIIMLRSLARLMAFARRDFSTVRSMVVITFSYEKLSDNLYYISQSSHSQYVIARDKFSSNGWIISSTRRSSSHGEKYAFTVFTS